MVSATVSTIVREGVMTMVYWAVYVLIATLLYTSTGDFVVSVTTALFLLLFLWPVAFLLDLLVAFVKALFRK